jgi:hypothetical protein
MTKIKNRGDNLARQALISVFCHSNNRLRDQKVRNNGRSAICSQNHTVPNKWYNALQLKLDERSGGLALDKRRFQRDIP